MQHVTLNTGNSEDFINPPLFVLDFLKEGGLQEPYDRYSVTALFAGAGWFYFDLSLDGEHVTANMICLSDSSDGCWEQITSLYLQIYGSTPAIPANSPPAPWLATVILPNPAIFGSKIVAQIEQAIAISAIRKGKP
jgi:hypothetical protein